MITRSWQVAVAFALSVGRPGAATVATGHVLCIDTHQLSAAHLHCFDDAAVLGRLVEGAEEQEAIGQ